MSLAKTLLGVTFHLRAGDTGCNHSLMRLKDWLSETDTTQIAFAERLRVRRETVIRWCADENIPDMPTILEIERQTDGRVTAEDWADAQRRRSGSDQIEGATA